LAGEVEKKTLPVYQAEWYEKNAIQLLLGCEVTAIDRQGKSVTLSDGRSLAYDRLILTTGARPSVPPIPGTDSSGVLTLRTMTDADQLLERLNHTRACIAIGGGLLGLETAGAIAHHGVGVTLLEVAPWLMPRQLKQPLRQY
jgi:nitrite reductase (NADH) large subunit